MSNHTKRPSMNATKQWPNAMLLWWPLLWYWCWSWLDLVATFCKMCEFSPIWQVTIG